MLRSIANEMTFGKVARRENPVASQIPYTRHVRDEVVKTREGHYMAFIKLTGFSFETADQEEINSRLAARNDLIRTLNSSRFALTQTIIRREVTPELGGSFDNEFCHQLDWRYQDKLRERRMFVNDFYLSISRRELQGTVGTFENVFKLFRGKNRDSGISAAEENAVSDLMDMINQLKETLAAYGAKILSVVKRDGTYFSEPLEFLVQLVNGNFNRQMPLPRMALNEAMSQKRIHFGKRALHIWGESSASSRYGAILSCREYPAMTQAGFLDGLLSVPHEFIVTQTFAIIDKPTALVQFDRTARQIDMSDERGSIVATQLDSAKDELLIGEALYGEHHLTVMPLVDDMRKLDRAVQDVGAVLTDMSVLWVREDLNMEAAFWAQLPGNFGHVARKAIISSKNFAGFASLHNYPSGKSVNNHWGPAVSVFETTSQTAYYFNFHVNDLGNFTVVGPSGGGKTVFLTFIAAQSQRITPRPKLVFIDKDRGAEIFIRAMGGQYDVLEPGKPTGFNPLMLENSPPNREFLFQLFSFMLQPASGEALRAAEEQLLRDAIVKMMGVPSSQRSFTEFATLLRGRFKATEDDLHARLQTWMKETQDGWLFNNTQDSFELGSIFGFDMTSVLEIPKIRTAALMYLFHRFDELLDGSPVLIFLDEGWKLLDDDVFIRFIRDKLKTIRKLNGVVGFGTQSASDIVNSKAAATLIEQTATNIFFPNPKADEDSYKKAFNLSRREFEWLRESVPEQRQFIIKHGQDSVIARLNLNGMKDVLKILSGRKETVNELEAIMERVGSNPDDWMPIFIEEEVRELTR